jgi:4-hydroxy-tetrahydrodipicolinate synthase
VFTEPGLIGAKYGVSQLGKCTEDVRLPLTILRDETKVKMRSGMLHAGLIN